MLQLTPYPIVSGRMERNREWEDGANGTVLACGVDCDNDMCFLPPSYARLPRLAPSLYLLRRVRQDASAERLRKRRVKGPFSTLRLYDLWYSLCNISKSTPFP